MSMCVHGEGVNFATVLSYADDTKALQGIANQADQINLQSDLGSLFSWADYNNNTFNVEKFESITYSSYGISHQYLDPEGNVIESKTHLRDLGVIMSNDATFTRHINVIVSKGQKIAGWALRVFHSREEELMLTLYKSLIRHSLEYCSPLWFPKDQTNISAIEKVQRSFTKRVKGLEGLNY